MAVPIFAFDLISSPKIAVGTMFLAAVLVSGLFCRRRGVVLTALWCVGLLLLASLFDPENPINTAIRIGAIAITAFLVVRAQSSRDELVEAKDRFRALAESSLTGVYLVEDGLFKYVNPALAKMFGYDADELVGRLGPIDLSYPPDRPLVAENIRRRVEGVAEEIRYELRGVRKDGSVFPIEVHGRGIELAGRVGVMGTLLDNSERQRALDELRSSEARSLEMQRLAHVGWWERDFRTERVTLSDEVRRIFGLEPTDLPDWHERWLKLIHPEDRRRAAEASEAAVRGEGRYDVEYRVVRADGSVRDVHSQGDVVRDRQGRPMRQFGVLQDVTDLRQAEQELRASEARFRTFVDHAADAFFLHDDDLTVIDVNRQACLSLGYERDELIGMQPMFFDAGLNEPSLETLARRIAAGETVTFETAHRRKDGSVFPVEARAGRFEQGGKFRRLTVVRDITERKQAEEALRRSEAHMAAAESLSRTGSWAWKPGANEITHWSKGRYRLFGFDPAAGVPSLEAILGRIHPEDRGPWLENRSRVAGGGEADFDFRIVLPDGETRHVHAVGRPIRDQSGEVVEIIGVIVDITDQKQAQQALRESEEQWKAVFENNPAMYFMVDPDTFRILSVNPFGARQLGYVSNELIGQPIDILLHEADRELAKKNKRACLERVGQTTSWEVRKVRKDGQLIWTRETGRAMLLKNRPVILVASQDITAAKEAAAALREMETQLARANRLEAMGQLTASIAHEVTQPIAANLNNAQAALHWLRHDPPNLQEVSQSLSRIARDSARAGDVVQRIRNLTRKAPPREEQVDVNAVIREVIEIIRSEAMKNAVSVRTQLASDLPPVQGDRVELQQVVLNLMLNAVEAMSGVADEPRLLQIATERTEAGDALVSVSDTGPGLPPDVQQNLFKPFFTTRPSGLGLGLSICRAIVEQRGGKMSASANSPHGAVFQVRLPRCPGASAQG